MNLLDRISYDTGGYTVQEILSSFCKKILEIIDLVNKNEEVCNEAKTIIENIRNEVVPQLVDDIMKELQDNGYFDNLVNVTLIENLRTELTTLLNQTITDFTTRLDNFDSQLEQKAKQVDLEVVNNRVSNLIIHSGEGIEKDAELIDCRVGEDGEIYPTSGDAIRKQFSTLKGYVDCIQYVNLVSLNNVESGYLSQNIGTSTISDIQANNEYVTSPIINVSSNEKFYVYVKGFTVALFYSSDGILRAKQALTNNAMQEITVPSDENEITKMRIFNSSSNTDFFISKISNTLEDKNNVIIENLTPSELLIDKLKNNLAYNQLKDNVSEIDRNIFEKASKKVPYNFTNIKAFVRYDDGSITESTDGNSTDFIALTNDDTWLVSGRCQYSACLIATYDNNKTFLRSYGRTDGSLTDYSDYEFKPKQDEKYAKFGSIYTTLTLAKKQTVKVVKDFSTNKLKGMSVYSDGDSITFGAKGTSYIKQIADNEGMILTNGAVSGTSLAIREGRTDSICERIKALTGTYKYIVVSGGVNDAFASIPLGTMDSDTNQQYLATFDTKTTLGALEEICRTLIYNFPDSKKLFVLTHRLLNGDGTTWSNSLQDKYWDGIIKVLDKWGIPYIDMRKIPFASFNSNYLSKYFGENESMGTHPNTLGYTEFYVNPITSKMKTL